MRSCKCEPSYEPKSMATYPLTVCSDAEDTLYVYAWRLEQEAALREAKGSGMTDDQVVNFVNGCKCMHDTKQILLE